jgi:hypothetical protein
LAIGSSASLGRYAVLYHNDGRQGATVNMAGKIPNQFSL